MKRILGSMLGAVAALFLAASAQAIVIEGNTPSGQFKAVGLDNQGRFNVNIATGSAYRVITDTGSVITTIQNPVEVKGNALAVPVPVSGAGGGPVPVSGAFSVSASTVATPVTAQVNHTAVAGVKLPSDPQRKQSIICNNDPSLTVWLGAAGVNTTTGIPLAAGGCMSPDVPASFIGDLYGISTMTALTGTISYIYFK